MVPRSFRATSPTSDANHLKRLDSDATASANRHSRCYGLVTARRIYHDERTHACRGHAAYDATRRYLCRSTPPSLSDRRTFTSRRCDTGDPETDVDRGQRVPPCSRRAQCVLWALSPQAGGEAGQDTSVVRCDGFGWIYMGPISSQPYARPFDVLCL